MSDRSSKQHLVSLSVQGWDGCAFAEEINGLQRQRIPVELIVRETT